MKKAIRVLSFTMTTLMVAAMAVGCKGSTGTKTTVATGGPKKYSQQVEIKIPVYDRGTQGAAPVDNNYWTKYVQTNFGDKYNIKVTFVPIPRTSDIDKFNLLLASGTAPDVIFSYDYSTAMSFYNRGAYQTLNTSTIKTYAPDYYKRNSSVMKYGQVKNQQIFLPATRPATYNWVTLIRQDWLDKIGAKIPANQDEYENVLKQFKAQQLGGNSTIPLTYSLSKAYYPAYGQVGKTMSEKDIALYSDTAVCALSYSAVKAQLKFDNKLYNEGLISPEWSLDKDGKKAQADFTSGKAGVYGCYLTKDNPPIIQTLLQNVPTAKVAILTNVQPAGNNPITRADNAFGMLSGINKKCAHPEAVMMYFNWLSQDKNLFTMQNGIEGKNYTLDSSGLPVAQNNTGDEKLNYNSNKDYWCLVTEGKDFGSDDKNLKVMENTYAPTGYEYLIENAAKLTKSNEKYAIHDYLFNTAIASQTKYAPTLLTKWQADQVKLVTAKESDFDTAYNAAVKDYLASGYQEILDEKLKVYNSMTSSGSSSSK